MKLALVGNPNSGKSTLFNHLTGLRQKVANFPGVTVEKKSGTFRLPSGEEATLIDLPGAYSLYPSSQDERVVLNTLANPADPNYPDALVYVADITTLERHLLLLTQIRDLGLPCLLALNMTDTADQEGLFVNEATLSAFLRMPVVAVSGRMGKNMEGLRQEIGKLLSRAKEHPAALLYPFSQVEQKTVWRIQSEIGVENPYRALLWAHHFQRLDFLSKKEKEAIGNICREEGFHDLRLQIDETLQRFRIFTPVLEKATHKGQKSTLTDRLDAVLTHRHLAPLIFFALMFLVFQAIFTWAELPMGWIENGFAFLNTWLKGTLPNGWLTDLLTDGLLAGLSGILVFIPQIAILFFLVTLLEEVGYMARAVFIFDKLMQKFGMNGRSIVALISGGACAIPAIMSTRTISNEKERLITILVTPFISCSARLPVYAVLVGFVVPPETVLGVFNLQGMAFMGLYLLGIAAALAAALVLKKTLKSKESSWLMLELPSYRPPVWSNVGHVIWEKVRAFMVEAGKIILIISIVLWALASYGPTGKMQAAENEAIALAQQQSLDTTATADLVASRRIEASWAGHAGKFVEPAIAPLGFDWKIGVALLTSFAAREVFVGTMATLYSIGSSGDEMTLRQRLADARHPATGQKVYTPAAALALLIFYVFAMQCMSTLAIVRRETGSWRWALLQFAFMTGLAYFGALLAFQLLN